LQERRAAEYMTRAPLGSLNSGEVGGNEINAVNFRITLVVGSLFTLRVGFLFLVGHLYGTLVVHVPSGFEKILTVIMNPLSMKP
jgi:photosystem II CP43 chlorophyll apoprotein